MTCAGQLYRMEDRLYVNVICTRNQHLKIYIICITYMYVRYLLLFLLRECSLLRFLGIKIYVSYIYAIKYIMLPYFVFFEKQNIIMKSNIRTELATSDNFLIN